MVIIARRLILMISVIILLGTVQLTSAMAPPEVQQAAQKGLSQFLTNIPALGLANQGFTSQEEIKAAALGTPFEMFTITPEALKSYKTGTRLSSLISTTNIWNFPVLVKGSPRTMLQVGVINGRWEGYNFGGGAFLPTRWQEMQTRASALLGQKRGENR